ncbi:MAG: SCO family protein [Burkholderiaceae bacterium]
MTEISAPNSKTQASVFDRPLDMTVHALPAASTSTLQSVPTLWHGRWRMLAVLLVCAMPVIASYFTYFVVRPDGRRNFGELIEPQRPMPLLASQQLDGHAGNLRQLKGQWLLVSVAGATCTDACQKQLYLQRQLRQALGKDKERLDWVWLVNDTEAVPAALLPALRDATVLRVAQQPLADWLVPAPGQTIADHLYVIDPMGNWMLRFPAGLDLANASKAKKDLDRLLRASAFWDRAGREDEKNDGVR